MSIVRHEPGGILSQVVEGGGLIFTAGVVASDRGADIKGQTAQVLAELDRLLALAGASKSNILSATIWVTDIRYREPMNEVWLDWIDTGNIPARACIEAKLADPRALVEIAVVACR